MVFEIESHGGLKIVGLRKLGELTYTYICLSHFVNSEGKTGGSIAPSLN